MSGKRRSYRLLAVMLGVAVGYISGERQSLDSSRTAPKREFRGVWIQTAYQTEYKDKTPAALKADFVRKLNILQRCGINAVLFQARPEADAFYPSALEPWSRFFTGKQGRAPAGNFDMLAFLIAECHKRNMEFHAWLNPYRAGTSETITFADTHIIRRYPERFVKYNRQVWFDPGQPQNRRFICEVVKDIVSRYDVDAIHLDDYFYPYPAAGVPFPDNKSFERYGKSQGYTEATRGDWRRNNVNMLVKEIRQTIRAVKPWVRFGISPFGIYRNRENTPDGAGSHTNGVQNYDDLYADVLLWMKEGWVDYVIPQLYWDIGYAGADYITLIEWWNRQVGKQHLYVGQDVARTMNAGQLTQKMRYERRLPHIDGHCLWPANEVLRNNGGIVDSLRRHYHRYPALLPAYTHLYDRKPRAITNLRAEYTPLGVRLKWQVKRNPLQPVHYFVIYRFGDKEEVDINAPAHIVAITQDMSYFILRSPLKERSRYVVTAVDRYHNESKKGKTLRVR